MMCLKRDVRGDSDDEYDYCKYLHCLVCARGQIHLFVHLYPHEGFSPSVDANGQRCICPRVKQTVHMRLYNLGGKIQWSHNERAVLFLKTFL